MRGTNDTKAVQPSWDCKEKEGYEGGLMKSEQERIAHSRFVQALQHEHLTCARPSGGAMDVVDHTPHCPYQDV